METGQTQRTEAAAPEVNKLDMSLSDAMPSSLKANADCIFFLASPLMCKKGDQCEFRHSQAARLNPRECYFWMNQRCLKPNCPFRHPPLSAISAEAKGGSAAVAADTASAEAEQSGGYGAHQQEWPGKSHVPCIFFQRGYCAKGAFCPFLHDGASATPESAQDTSSGDAAQAQTPSSADATMTTPAVTVSKPPAKPGPAPAGVPVTSRAGDQGPPAVAQGGPASSPTQGRQVPGTPAHASAEHGSQTSSRKVAPNRTQPAGPWGNPKAMDSSVPPTSSEPGQVLSRQEATAPGGLVIRAMGSGQHRVVEGRGGQALAGRQLAATDGAPRTGGREGAAAGAGGTSRRLLGSALQGDVRRGALDQRLQGHQTMTPAAYRQEQNTPKGPLQRFGNVSQGPVGATGHSRSANTLSRNGFPAERVVGDGSSSTAASQEGAPRKAVVEQGGASAFEAPKSLAEIRAAKTKQRIEERRKQQEELRRKREEEENKEKGFSLEKEQSFVAKAGADTNGLRKRAVGHRGSQNQGGHVASILQGTRAPQEGSSRQSTSASPGKPGAAMKRPGGSKSSVGDVDQRKKAAPSTSPGSRESAEFKKPRSLVEILAEKKRKSQGEQEDGGGAKAAQHKSLPPARRLQGRSDSAPHSPSFGSLGSQGAKLGSDGQSGALPEIGASSSASKTALVANGSTNGEVQPGNTLAAKPFASSSSGDGTRPAADEDAFNSSAMLTEENGGANEEWPHSEAEAEAEAEADAEPEADPEAEDALVDVDTADMEDELEQEDVDLEDQLDGLF